MKMKALIQRVMQAKVTVDDEVVSSVGRGLCVLIGITRKDTPKEMEYLARKILNLRVFDDDQGKRWSKNVMEKQYEVLCVSQFTLAVTMKGNKPDFHEAMGPDESQPFYGEFLKQMGMLYDPVKIKDGKFGAYMQVHIQNDGPVTIPLETPASLQEMKKPIKWSNPKINKTPNKVKSDNTASSEVGASVSEVKATDISESLEDVSIATEIQEDSEIQNS